MKMSLRARKLFDSWAVGIPGAIAAPAEAVAHWQHSYGVLLLPNLSQKLAPGANSGDRDRDAVTPPSRCEDIYLSD